MTQRIFSEGEVVKFTSKFDPDGQRVQVFRHIPGVGGAYQGRLVPQGRAVIFFQHEVEPLKEGESDEV